MTDTPIPLDPVAIGEQLTALAAERPTKARMITLATIGHVLLGALLKCEAERRIADAALAGQAATNAELLRRVDRVGAEAAALRRALLIAMPLLPGGTPDSVDPAEYAIVSRSDDALSGVAGAALFAELEAARAVVRTWDKLGDCEEEFADYDPAGTCAEWRDALDGAILTLKGLLAGERAANVDRVPRAGRDSARSGGDDGGNI